MTTTHEEPKRIDRRVLRTRKAIERAFDKLLSNSSVDKITVSAIAREADIDRKTFYLHYKSVEELANRKTEELLERILDKLKTDGVGKTHLERVHILLAETNAVLTSNIPLYSNTAFRLSTDQVLARFSHVAEPALRHAGLNPELASNKQLYMKIQFFVAGAIYLYSTWLRSDHKQPIETVSDAIEDAIATMYQKGKHAEQSGEVSPSA